MEGLDPARDRQGLLGLYPTAFCPPQRFGFQAHMGDTVSVTSLGFFPCFFRSTRAFVAPFAGTSRGRSSSCVLLLPVR